MFRWPKCDEPKVWSCREFREDLNVFWIGVLTRYDSLNTFGCATRVRACSSPLNSALMTKLIAKQVSHESHDLEILLMQLSPRLKPIGLYLLHNWSNWNFGLNKMNPLFVCQSGRNEYSVLDPWAILEHFAVYVWKSAMCLIVLATQYL